MVLYHQSGKPLHPELIEGQRGLFSCFGIHISTHPKNLPLSIETRLLWILRITYWKLLATPR